jgi:hypothetical protein
MKIAFKIFLIIFIVTTTAVSILYGSRILNIPYEYGYSDNSLILTIPNKLWVELNSQQDYLLKGEKKTAIFQNSLLEYTEFGNNIGPQYPIYAATIKKDIISKTDIVTRKGNNLNIRRAITLNTTEQYDHYISDITFSELGEYNNNTFSQEGCDIKTESQTGDIQYDKESSTISVSYTIENDDTIIDDKLNISVYCKGL